MITIIQLKGLLEKNSSDLSEEFKRIFHGRGNYYEGWNFLTIDSIDTILSIAFYKEFEDELRLFEMLKEFIKDTRHDTIIVQRRYLQRAPTEILTGTMKDENYAIENGIKIKLNLQNNQNNGYFPDMKKGREWVKQNTQDKNILNLFSYTCAFSLFASKGGAIKVTNVDMAKGALTTGRENHHINDISTYNIQFMPYNILKSFSRIKKNAPYDMIIIDPPTFQKGSFEAGSDYQKILRRLDQLSSEECTVLACLNSPDLDSQYLISLFEEFAPNFVFEKRIENLEEFIAIDDERALKNLVFKKNKFKVY
ncbi:MAG: class I SAM-dependent methyltransferase [Campylobacterota bacterium]|nr:class I SAM-dependent methyltransferase [Campylobacterota bacterium]